MTGCQAGLLLGRQVCQQLQPSQARQQGQTGQSGQQQPRLGPFNNKSISYVFFYDIIFRTTTSPYLRGLSC